MWKADKLHTQLFTVRRDTRDIPVVEELKKVKN